MKLKKISASRFSLLYFTGSNFQDCNFDVLLNEPIRIIQCCLYDTLKPAMLLDGFWLQASQQISLYFLLILSRLLSCLSLLKTCGFAQLSPDFALCTQMNETLFQYLHGHFCELNCTFLTV
jgi:hypothetical protein